MERDAIQHGHSTPQMAGAFAKRVNAERLVLTHFSPRCYLYLDPNRNHARNDN